jgi:hypothetical protein
VRDAHGVPVLTVGADDGRYHLILCLTPSARTVVAIERGPVLVLAAESVDNQERDVLQLRARAYYPAPHAKPLAMRARQLLPATATDESAYVDRIDVGVVPPMIASREYAPPGHRPLLMTPCCELVRGMSAPLVANRRPAALSATELRHLRAVRPIVLDADPLRENRSNGFAAALTHLEMWQTNGVIASDYPM